MRMFDLMILPGGRSGRKGKSKNPSFLRRRLSKKSGSGVGARFSRPKRCTQAQFLLHKTHPLIPSQEGNEILQRLFRQPRRRESSAGNVSFRLYSTPHNKPNTAGGEKVIFYWTVLIYADPSSLTSTII